MSSYRVNDDGVAKARTMITSTQYVLDSDWSAAQPSPDDGNAAIDRNGWKWFSDWHLTIDDDASDETKARYAFPFGDFDRVHRSALIAAKQRAAQNDHADVERAADELLELLDDVRGD
ncbi:MAG: hypothetical protein KY460_03695 [Actinobacteria bacterium]|nr:hypothetical protein [Actinomycetota bacterium]